MLKDWKIRQKIYHNMIQEHDDDLSNNDVKVVVYRSSDHFEEIAKAALDKYPIELKDSSDHIEHIAHDAIKYIIGCTTDEPLLYPGKSYAVALCYSYNISKHFGGDMLDILADADLLYGNDPFFYPYIEDEDKAIYDLIIKKGVEPMLETPEFWSENFKKTFEYFQKEFLLHESTEHFIAS